MTGCDTNLWGKVYSFRANRQKTESMYSPVQSGLYPNVLSPGSDRDTLRLSILLHLLWKVWDYCSFQVARDTTLTQNVMLSKWCCADHEQRKLDAAVPQETSRNTDFVKWCGKKFRLHGLWMTKKIKMQVHVSQIQEEDQPLENNTTGSEVQGWWWVVVGWWGWGWWGCFQKKGWQKKLGRVLQKWVIASHHYNT